MQNVFKFCCVLGDYSDMMSIISEPASTVGEYRSQLSTTSQPTGNIRFNSVVEITTLNSFMTST